MLRDGKLSTNAISGHRPALLALLSAAVVAASACSTWHPPALRQPATEPSSLPDPATAEERVAECDRLRTELRRNQIARQEAPDTTTSPIIAEASEAKADRNIDIIQSRYRELECDAPATAKPAVPPNSLP